MPVHINPFVGQVRNPELLLTEFATIYGKHQAMLDQLTAAATDAVEGVGNSLVQASMDRLKAENPTTYQEFMARLGIQTERTE